jgi:hypothetical protein
MKERELRYHAGGSWADGGPEHIFGIYGGGGHKDTYTSGTIGFRLVMSIEESQ